MCLDVFAVFPSPTIRGALRVDITMRDDARNCYIIHDLDEIYNAESRPHARQSVKR